MPSIAAPAKDAAKALGLREKQFLELVEGGYLPPPTHLGPHRLWMLADLEAILRGKAGVPDGGLEI